MLNVHNADYVNDVLGKMRTCIVVLPKSWKMVTRGEEMLNKLCYFVYFCTQKVFSQVRKIEVQPLMSHGLFYRCPCYVSGTGNIAVALLSMQGQRVLRFNQKYLNLCSEDERMSLCVWKDMKVE